MSKILDKGELEQRDGDGNENGKKSHRFRLAKQQLCTCIMLFCTFHCRCTTTTRNVLILAGFSVVAFYHHRFHRPCNHCGCSTVLRYKNNLIQVKINIVATGFVQILRSRVSLFACRQSLYTYPKMLVALPLILFPHPTKKI